MCFCVFSVRIIQYIELFHITNRSSPHLKHLNLIITYTFLHSLSPSVDTSFSKPHLTTKTHSVMTHGL